jgi:hypothetical protein
MKMKKLIIVLVCVSSILSCRKTDKNFEEPIPITSQSVQKQIDYASKHLKQITEGIALFAKDKDFVSFVHVETKKKFDDEYEVLIQDLQMNSTWKQKMNVPKINNALNAFKNIDGSNYYPQIYIPKFQHEEDMKEEKNYTPPTENIISELIVYIYYSGDAEVDSSTNENESYAGYVLDSTNQLVYWGMVNEEYANDNEVWVISLNESVGNGGNFCPPEYVNGGYQYCPESLYGYCCGGDNPPPPPPGGCNGDPDCDPTMFAPTTIPFPELGHNKVNFRITEMVVKDGKESWLAGKSEISIRAVLNCHNDRTIGSPYPAITQRYKSDQTANYLGNLIRKYKRREINRGTQVLVNYNLQTNWQNSNHLQDPVYFDYVIFERDIWPAPKQTRLRTGREDRLQTPGGIADSYYLDYRSGGERYNDFRQYEYYQGGFFNTQFLPLPYNAIYYDGAIITNNTIGYKTVAY